MKKVLAVALAIFIISSLFIPQISAFADSVAANENTVLEPVEYTDNNGTFYSIKFSKDEKDKRFLWFKWKYISSFKIEMMRTDADNVETVYTFKTKDYNGWFAPKTLEKALKKEKLTDFYDKWLDFQAAYVSWHFVKDMDSHEFFLSRLNSTILSRVTKEKNRIIEKYQNTVDEETKVKDKVQDLFESKIIDKLGVFNPDEYSSMIENTNKFIENIAELFAEYASTVETLKIFFNAVGPDSVENFEKMKLGFKDSIDEEIKALFDFIDQDSEKSDSKFKKASTNYVKYTTQFAKKNLITVPEFEFVYPSDWEITKEVVAINDGPVLEQVELTKDNLKVTYMSSSGRLGGYGRNWITAEAEEVAKSSFIPKWVQGSDYSSLGEFVVAKIHETGYMRLDTDTDFQEIDKYYYAVIPKSYLGEMGYAHRWDEVGFKYGLMYLFLAESDTGAFTSEEEKEIFKILSSFKSASLF